MRKRISRLAVVLPLILSATSCAIATPTTSPAYDPQVVAVVSVNEPVRYDAADITVTALPGTFDRTALFPAEELTQLCNEGGGAICDGGSEPTLTLGMANSATIGESTKTFVPLFDKRPVYVMTYRPDRCDAMAGGKYSPEQSSQAPRTIPNCRIADFVDALSGKFLYATRGSADAG